jgi:uncharacterized protein (TIGR01777 family)
MANADAKRIVIAGASGLIGSHLGPFLAGRGHDVVRLVRHRPASAGAEVYWNPATGELDVAALGDVDAAINLAGASIAGGRWTREYKAEIYDSRVKSTELLCRTLAGLARPPQVLISASAVGYYGNRGEERVDEEAAPGGGFLSQVCQAWEAATAHASGAGIRVVHLRFGLVLSGDGGALAKMRTPFRLGLGGVVGSGRQYMSWIAMADVLGVIEFALGTPGVNGPVNATSPAAVTNREFTKTLGQVLRRPTIVPLPGFAVRAMFGEMGQACLLEGVRAAPQRLIESGYSFRHATLESALRAELRRES